MVSTRPPPPGIAQRRQARGAPIVNEARDTMKLPILPPALAALALSIASLSGCTRDADPAPAAHVDAGAPASQGRASYMDEFNESIRSMSGEHESGVHINRGWGVFNTIKAAPAAEPAASACAASSDASIVGDAGGARRAHARRPNPAAGDSRMS